MLLQASSETPGLCARRQGQRHQNPKHKGAEKAQKHRHVLYGDNAKRDVCPMFKIERDEREKECEKKDESDQAPRHGPTASTSAL